MTVISDEIGDENTHFWDDKWFLRNRRIRYYWLNVENYIRPQHIGIDFLFVFVVKKSKKLTSDFFSFIREDISNLRFFLSTILYIYNEYEKLKKMCLRKRENLTTNICTHDVQFFPPTVYIGCWFCVKLFFVEFNVLPRLYSNL